MATLKFEIDSKEFDFMDDLRRYFPQLRAQTLGYVGYQVVKILRKDFLSGQELDLQAYPYDRKGRRTASYSINKRVSQTTVSSYPVNLFETGRTLRSGNRESPKNIIRQKLKQSASGNMQRILNEFDKKYLQAEIDKRV